MSYSAGNLDVVLQSVSNTSIKSLDAVLARLKKISPLLQKMGGKTTTKFGGGLFGGSKNSGLSGLFNTAKIGAVFYTFKRLGAIVGKIAQSGADYTETLNLWETSMGKNVNLATQFVNKMNDAYGISEKTLMNAQAIFKNMLGSLGQISDQTAYRLSEGVTQMAIDYASLYNVSFQKAFEKFQAALAGQVRPIRSVSGYDITENTLYQLYQSLGGTKSVRNLSRTEKQLLSLLAIFNQMTRSGAVGDLDKTMESYANQARVMAEAWEQVMTYAGVLLTYTIQESGLLTYVNAILIFLGDTLKAVAESMGAIQHFGGDVFGATTKSALTASDAIDEVTGKLFDFDKFRALSSSDNTSIGLDTRLLDAIAGYDSILANAKNEAKELADSWKSMSALFDKDGNFNPQKWEDLTASVETFATALGIILGANLLFNFSKGLASIITNASKLSAVLLGGAVFAIVEAINAFREGDTTAGIIATAIGVGLVGAFIALQVSQVKSYVAQKNLTKSMLETMTAQEALNNSIQRYWILLLRANGVSIEKIQWARQDITTTRQQTAEYLKQNTALKGQANAWAVLGKSIASATMAFSIADGIIGMFEGEGRKTASIIMTIAGAVLALTAAIVAMNTAITFGQALPFLMAGVGMAIAGVKGLATDIDDIADIPKYANGASNIDSGSLFIAGEMGKTEAVYSGSNGKTNVANVEQMEQAFYNALQRHENRGGNRPLIITLDGEAVYKNTTEHAKKHGNQWA